MTSFKGAFEPFKEFKTSKLQNTKLQSFKPPSKLQSFKAIFKGLSPRTTKRKFVEGKKNQFFEQREKIFYSLQGQKAIEDL
jgi:hypothetical protein